MHRPSCIDPKQLLENEAELSLEATVLIQKMKQTADRVIVFHSSYEGLAPLYRRLNETFILERTLPVRQHPWGPVYTQVDVYRQR